MTELFSILNRAVDGPGWLALTAAFAWGVLSIVLSPCHLAAIPLVIGYVSNDPHPTPRRALGLSAVFALGILLTIAAVGALPLAAGRMAGDIGAIGYYIVAAVFFIVGLHLLDVLPLPWSGGPTPAVRRRGLCGALVLGLVFGLALGPCTFAYMAPVLGVTFKVGALHPQFAAFLLLLFALGHCAVILAAGLLGERVQGYLRWSERHGHVRLMRRLSGVLVILAGLYLLWLAP